MEKLEQLLATNPKTYSINLNFSGVSDISSLLTTLTKFPNLEEIHLSGNGLSVLPHDLAILPHLAMIDISNNPILDVKNIIPGLQTLQSLRHVYVSLDSEEQEQYLRDNLEGVVVANTGVSRKDNRYEDTRQKLVDNSKRFNTEEGVWEDGSRLHGTEKLVDLDHLIQEEHVHVSIKQADIEHAKDIHEVIRSIHKTVNPEQNEALAAEFDDQVNSIMKDLSVRIDTEHLDFLDYTAILKAKYHMYDICTRSLSDLLIRTSPQIGEVLATLRENTSSIFMELVGTMLHLQPKMNDRLHSYKKEFERTKDEIAEILQAAEHLEKENTTLLEDKRLMRENFETEKEKLFKEIDELRAENKNYLDTIIRHSKSSKASVANGPSMLATGKVSHVRSPVKGRSSSPSHIMVDGQIPTLQLNLGEEDDEYDRIRSRLDQTINERKPGNMTTMTQGGSPAPHSGGKTLSLKILKDTLDDIYIQKDVFVKKCFAQRQPKETMEQYLYTYLNQKYGLKALILEWSGGIINGIKKYAKYDNDVAVFGKILKNETDEEFRFIQKKVKESALELLKMQIKAKNPLKNSTNLQKLIDEKLAGSLTAEEWKTIIRFMYKEDDAQALVNRVRDFINGRNQQSARGSITIATTVTPSQGGSPVKKMSRREEKKEKHEQNKNASKINYDAFIKILLDFQLQRHEQFLSSFLTLFNEVDRDANGIINEIEFRDLLALMGYPWKEKEVKRLLEKLDPFNNKQICFSDLIGLFSTEIAPSKVDGAEKYNVLQQLHIDQHQ